MSRRVQLPTRGEVVARIGELRAQDRQLTAKGLAESFGLSNTTFWRYFPELAQEVADARRVRPRTVRPDGREAATNAEAVLRAELETARAQLDLAIAHIHRLSVENASLRRQVPDPSNVIRFPSG